MSLTSNNYVRNDTSVGLHTRPFELSPWLSRVHTRFTLQDNSNLPVTTPDREVLKYYGIDLVRMLETGSYSKAPIYLATWNKKEVCIKAVRLIESKPNRHAKYELAVVSIIRHPNIVNHLSYFKSAHRIYNVMEYVAGGTLNKYIKEHMFINYAVVKDIYHDIVCAVDYLHSKYIAHRDIKDDNIVLSFNDRGRPIPKLCDFGFAVRLSSHEELLRSYCGTRSFKSPELIHAVAPYNPFKAEVWALGILLHKMLNRTVPTYCQEKKKIIIDFSKFPKWAADIINATLKVDPSERLTVHSLLYSKLYRLTDNHIH